MFDFVTEKVAEQVARGVKLGISPLAPYLRKLATGAALVITSVFAFAFALLFLSVTFFFLFKGTLHPYFWPAFWVFLINVLVGLLFLLLGLKRLRPPR